MEVEEAEVGAVDLSSRSNDQSFENVVPDVDGIQRARISKYEAFKLNLKLIYRALRNEEIHRPLIFFLMLGFVIPTFDNIHYYFLLNTCGMTLTEYDLLSILSYVGVAIGTLIYLKFLRNVEVWKLIFASLIIRMIITVV